MKDYKKYIFPLLRGESLSSKDYEVFKKEVKSLIKATFSYAFTFDVEALFKKAYGDDYLEDLFQDFLLRLFQNKEIILKLKFINKKYLVSVIQNIIYYHLSSDFKPIKRQKSFEEIVNWEDEEEKVKAEEQLPATVHDHLKKLRLNHWFNELQKRLSEIDKEVFCYYLFKHLLKKEMELKTLSKTNLYKRWERLKTKLKNILGTALEEGVEELKELFDVFLVKICKKKFLIKE